MAASDIVFFLSVIGIFLLSYPMIIDNLSKKRIEKVSYMIIAGRDVISLILLGLSVVVYSLYISIEGLPQWPHLSHIAVFNSIADDPEKMMLMHVLCSVGIAYFVPPVFLIGSASFVREFVDPRYWKPGPRIKKKMPRILAGLGFFATIAALGIGHVT